MTIATDPSPYTRKLIRAAQYIRMSTEHQQYSTENQRDAIREYAERRGYEVVATYADEGKSGLRMEGRDALSRLLVDVQSGQAGFTAILVYDVSRWGRFQDADESAYYEYSCKRMGIEVHYCTEQFENDGQLGSTVMKSLKRVMAGEYSRELSNKVFKGQCRLIEMGYRQGGPAGFGLRRMLIDQSGAPKSLLKRGEHKSLQTDRVVLVPGPNEETELVREVYELFVRQAKSEGEISALLNERGITTDLGRRWTRSTVRQLLTNEKYIGNNVYNRRSFKLKKRRIQNAPDQWVRADGAFPPIVAAADFFTAQGIIQERDRRISDDEMVAQLRSLLEKHQTVSGHLIDACERMPSSSAYRSRFGSLVRAYRLAGYVPSRDYEYLAINQNLRGLYPSLVEDVVRRLHSAGASVSRDSATDLLLINGEYSAAMVLSRCRRTTAGSLRWLIRINSKIAPDITILVRMDPANQTASDYYLLPIMDLETPRLLLCESNGCHLDTYQFESLEYFAELAARSPIPEVA